MSAHTTIRYEAADGVGTITLNRPDRMNGIVNTMMRELYEVLSAVALDPSVRVLVLTGAGKAFCPGADLKRYTTNESDERLLPEYFHLTTLLHEVPQVTIAAINGACAGAGLGWACACDLRIAASSATFNTAFLDVGVAGDMALPWSLPRIVGAAKARELSFLPGKFAAEEALRIGLVNRVLPDDSFRSGIDEVARTLAGKAPLALRGLKDHYLAGERMTMRDFVNLETERHTRISASEDTQEGFRAFLEKRPPQFKGY